MIIAATILWLVVSSDGKQILVFASTLLLPDWPLKPLNWFFRQEKAKAILFCVSVDVEYELGSENATSKALCMSITSCVWVNPLKQLSVLPEDARLPFMWSLHKHKKAWAKLSLPSPALTARPKQPLINYK